MNILNNCSKRKEDDHTWPVPYEGNGGRSVGRGRSSTCTQSEKVFKFGFRTQISKRKICFIQIRSEKMQPL